jgi:hypothetical protein
VIRAIFDMEATDPSVELSRQPGESLRWHLKERVELVRGQLNAEPETGARRVPKELAAEPRVRQ